MGTLSKPGRAIIAALVIVYILADVMQLINGMTVGTMRTGAAAAGIGVGVAVAVSLCPRLDSSTDAFLSTDIWQAKQDESCLNAVS